MLIVAFTVTPVFAGNLPETVYPLVARISGEQQMLTEAALTRNLDLAFAAFTNDPLVTVSPSDAKKLFDEMIENTRAYLAVY